MILQNWVVEALALALALALAHDILNSKNCCCLVVWVGVKMDSLGVALDGVALGVALDGVALDGVALGVALDWCPVFFLLRLHRT